MKSGLSRKVQQNLPELVVIICYFVLLSLVEEHKKHKVKDVLENVDSEGSTLLHLAVASGSLKVSFFQLK